MYTYDNIYFFNHLISFLFTGGESGIPLRLQIDTYLSNSSTDDGPVNSSGCQIKVFKVSSDSCYISSPFVFFHHIA